MASFQSKIGWKRPRKTENKSYRYVSFLSGTKQKIKKKLAKKLKNTKREKIKIIISFCSYPTHNRNFQKNSKKLQNIRKYHYGFISIQNRLEEAEKNRK